MVGLVGLVGLIPDEGNVHTYVIEGVGPFEGFSAGLAGDYAQGWWEGGFLGGVGVLGAENYLAFFFLRSFGFD